MWACFSLWLILHFSSHQFSGLVLTSTKPAEVYRTGPVAAFVCLFVFDDNAVWQTEAGCAKIGGWTLTAGRKRQDREPFSFPSLANCRLTRHYLLFQEVKAFSSDLTVGHSGGAVGVVGGVSRRADTADRKAATAGPQGRSHCHAVVAPLGRRRELINDDARRTSNWVKKEWVRWGGWGGVEMVGMGDGWSCKLTFWGLC